MEGGSDGGIDGGMGGWRDGGMDGGLIPVEGEELKQGPGCSWTWCSLFLDQLSTPQNQHLDYPMLLSSFYQWDFGVSRSNKRKVTGKGAECLKEHNV